jgi:outer membrane protein assembly factor BamB
VSIEGGTTELGRSGTLVWTQFQSLAVPAGVLVTDGGEQVDVEGTQAELAVDDGSARGVVLLRTGAGGTTIVAHDARSGDELWRATGSTGPVLVLDGAVVAAGSSTVVARDARTGHERWHARLGSSPTYLGADPLHVVVLTDELRLRTFDLADGRTASTTSVETLLDSEVGDLDGAHEYAGRLLVTFRDGSVVALG